MSSDRKMYVMAPELAMQREMAYRKRLKSSHPEQKIESREDPLSQSQKVTSFPTASFPSPWAEKSVDRPHFSRLHSSPSPMSSPKRTLNPQIKVGPKVTSPSPSNPFQYRSPSAISKPMLPPRGPIISPTFLAKPNLPSGSNPTNQRQILGPNLYRPQGQGLLPRPKSSTLGPITKPNPQSTKPVSLSGPSSGPRKKPISGPILETFCKVCGVNCSSPSNLEMHLKGQKHLAKLNEGNGKINVKVHCELCEIWCMNEFSYKQHLSGKSHTLKLHAAERKKW